MHQAAHQALIDMNIRPFYSAFVVLVLSVSLAGCAKESYWAENNRDAQLQREAAAEREANTLLAQQQTVNVTVDGVTRTASLSSVACSTCIENVYANVKAANTSSVSAATPKISADCFTVGVGSTAESYSPCSIEQDFEATCFLQALASQTSCARVKSEVEEKFEKYFGYFTRCEEKICI